VTAVTVASVSAGVALAATASPSADLGATLHQPSGGSGSVLTGASTSSPLSERVTLYRQEASRAAAAAAKAARAAGAAKPASRPSGHPPGSGSAGHAGKRQVTRRSTPTPSPTGTTEPAKPYEFYDAVDPLTVPAGAEVATYADGPHPTPVSEVAGRKQVLWIDITGSDPQAQVIDVEPGCATPAAVPQWVSSRLADVPGSVAIVYTMISEWPAVQSAVASLPAAARARIRWWIADPTGYPHVVPGSNATQWYWGPNYDISTALPDF
jgi:hypothetical protein